MWTHGRAWLFLKDTIFNVEWEVWSKRFGITLGLGYYDCALSFSLSLWFFSFHWHVDNHKLESWIRHKIKRPGETYGNGRAIGVTVHNWAIWVNLWQDPMETRSSDPKWWAFNIDIQKLLIGKAKYTEEVLSQGNTDVIMPENRYPAKFSIIRQTWTYTRWFFAKQRDFMKLEMEGKGIPIPGKGENSYDCGDDAIRGASTPVDFDHPNFTLKYALEDFAFSVLRTRAKYASLDWRPRDEADEILEEHAKCKMSASDVEEEDIAKKEITPEMVAGATDQALGKEPDKNA